MVGEHRRGFEDVGRRRRVWAMVVVVVEVRRGEAMVGVSGGRGRCWRRNDLMEVCP